MKILVTGGAGFIGSHIVDAYIDLGHEVVVIDDMSTGSMENIDASKCTFFRGDISNRNNVSELKKKHGPFDVVCHQAAQVSVSYSMSNPYRDIETNIIGTINILRDLGQDCKKFILASSGGTVYGEHDTPRIESDQLEPVSPYGISKLACEKHVKLYATLLGFDYAILRYSNVYGPRQSPHGEAGVVSIFLDKIMSGDVCTINGDGEYFRDYIYIDDVVSANIRALSEDVKGIYNVSTGKTNSTNDIWRSISSDERISRINPICVNGPHRDGDIRFSCCVPGSIPGWKPSVSFEDGMERTITWVC
jgi:UDP-glucose 4-epimerase